MSFALRCALVLAICASIVFARAPVLARGPDGALLSTLAALRDLSGSFAFVVDWSANPTPPATTFMDYERAEADILKLRRRDRDAVIFWLQSHGRQQLYDRGVSDAQIGPRRFPIDTFVSAAATPNPAAAWHQLPFVAGTLGGVPLAPIAITGGLSMVKNDATAEVHCVSFKNTDIKTAISITFAYRFLDANRAALAALTSVRTGAFSTNVAIDGPTTFATYLSAGTPGTPRSLADNCWRDDNGTATLALLLQARYFEFRVAIVTYADGSQWSAPAPGAP